MEGRYSFSEALIMLKDGRKVMRSGWNGKGMFLFLVKGQAIRYTINQTYGDGYVDSDGLPVLDAIYMKTADDKLVPWLASQTDLLAEDWQVA